MSSPRVVHTTLSARAVAEFAFSAFDLPARPSAQLVSRGFNDVYEIAADRPLFLRIGRQGRRSPADVELEACALAEAQAAGVPVAAALRGRDGRFGQVYTTVEGERAVLLFARAPGVDARAVAGHAHAQGKALARLHGMVLTDDTTARLRRLDIESLVAEPTRRAVAQLQDRPRLADRIRDVADGICVHLDRLQSSFSVGLCHGDSHGYNATIDGDSATLIDFDEAGIGWTVYDLATFLWSCHIVNSSDERELLWSHFLAGYVSVRSLPAVDAEALEAMMIVRELWTYGAQAEGAQHWGRRWFRSVYFEGRVERLAARFARFVEPRLL